MLQCARPCARLSPETVSPRRDGLWCNFDPPAQLHDYRFLGTNFRQRERLKRKKARWLAKLQRMTPLEAAAVLAAIDEWRTPSANQSMVDVML